MKSFVVLLFFSSITFAFETGKQFSTYQEITPSFDAQRDVRFLVFTRLNPIIGQQVVFNNLASLIASNFNPSRPTRFIIHGFQADATSDVNIVITAAYLRSNDVNVIVVDWGLGANTINFITARNRVPEMGVLIANYIDFLHEQNMVDFGRLYVIGSSLGAHIAGMTGKALTRGRINTIIGSDPGGPLFSVNDPTTRLAVGDAEYVECIHTDNRSFGIGAPICDLDWFPNGGSNQPGCLTPLCDHQRAFHLFAESLHTNLLWGRRCNNLEETTIGCSGEGAFLGGEPSNHRNNIRGIYYLSTNAATPFGQGPF